MATLKSPTTTGQKPTNDKQLALRKAKKETKVRKFVPIDVLRLLYFSFVHCHLQHCVISWGTANNSVLQPVSLTKQHITENDF